MGSGPSAGRGPGRLSCPFWRSSSGRCPLLPLGPEREASRRRPCFCSGLLPSPPGAAGLQLALKGGQARGRGAPGTPAPVGSEPRAPSLGGFSCLRERVCGHCSGGRGRARFGPRDPCALPRCGSRAGIRGRRRGGGGGGGARWRRYNPLPVAGRLHTRVLRSPLNSGSPACLCLLLLHLLFWSSRGCCGGASSALRPPSGPCERRSEAPGGLVAARRRGRKS